jgi:hypothetical protein
MSKTRKLLLSLIGSVLISIMILTHMFGCAGNQSLRGADYTRTEKPESFPEVELDKTSFVYRATPHIIWISVVLGLSFWLWKDYKKSNR